MSDGESTERLRVLVVTDLFPSVQDPHRAPFVLQALQYMGAHCDIRVLAPLSWVTWLKRLARGAPGGAARGWTGFGGVRCTRPLYFYLPKIGRSFYGIMYFLSIIGTVLRVRREWDFDAVVGVFAYPDGFASTLAARMLGKPAFLWVVGTDVNVYARYAVRRRMILWAVRSCRATVAASAALKQRLVELGAPADRIDVIYNGVNTAVFNRLEAEGEEREGVDGPYILYVGNLKREKGVGELVRAFSALRTGGLRLVLIGDGPFRAEARRLADELGVGGRVLFLGSRDHGTIARFMRGSKLLCLPSYNEGVPNVVLEALACGTPVVATAVGGIPEIIDSPQLGRLVARGDVAGLAAAIDDAVSARWDRESIARHIERFRWEEFASRFFQLLTKGNSD